jgi:hypothetical protein
MYTRHNEIRCLFDGTITRLIETRGPRFREYQIFMEVLKKKPETLEKFRSFLHDVSTCPQEVIQWCEKQILPSQV